ncbi:MAG: hypothetical protein JRJ12_08700 [Deltaproteobacteria bacterium]|nr:hypothetical protein [Deltaproteobacteria bacterium]MBW2069613.1 hypothetical protein [Deltaproteobacteria bacterium]
MAVNKALLLIPVENQVRELDPKLLLACVAARRGYSSVVGSRREMEFHIDSFPPSIYLSKSMTVRSLLFFRAARKLGHEIVAWDEEALVHLPPEIYYSRRLDPRAIRYVSRLFAWGKDNAELWEHYPHLPADLPIHITGNPRSDMLRSDICGFYQQEVDNLQKRYGDFILVNTNFNHVNAFGPDLNLFKPAKLPTGKPRFGRAARGMTREYAEGLRDHKQAVFEDFQRLIPMLDLAFPDFNIVVRPHPTESHEIYRTIAASCKRVEVTNDGNVVPWLMAARALVHNGCTTGVEAYLMGVPALSYRATIDERYDLGFYRLPNLLSHQCFSFEQLRDTLEKALAGQLEVAGDDDRQAIIAHYLAARHGPLGCERMLDVIEEMLAAGLDSNSSNTLVRRTVSAGLQVARNLKYHLPGSHNRPEFQQHRYPGISMAELQQRISRFQELLGDDRQLTVETISPVLFLISP